MLLSVRLLSVPAVLALFCSPALGQRRLPQPMPAMPPDIMDNTSVDVARIAPELYTAELENAAVRVLRGRLAPGMRVPTHAHPAGLVVALTPVHLRFVAPDGKLTELHLAAGETRWLLREIHAELNLAATACEFLFIEPNPGSPIPYSAPVEFSPTRHDPPLN